MTPNEKEILKILQELKPYEEIKITKDQTGKPDYFIITRTQKVVLSAISTIDK